MACWPAAGFEDTEFSVNMESRVDHGTTEVNASVQAWSGQAGQGTRGEVAQAAREALAPRQKTLGEDGRRAPLHPGTIKWERDSCFREIPLSYNGRCPWVLPD